MPDVVKYYRSPRGVIRVIFPVDPESVIEHWYGLRSRMIREVPEAFTRDEWAYLVSFLDTDNLRKPFDWAFGTSLSGDEGDLACMFRPRGGIALWLPNNVSLLGPLSLILLTLSGQPVRIKAGFNSKDLTTAFIQFALKHLPQGALRSLLEEQIVCEVFDRNDTRNADMASSAQVRMVFGSNAAAEAIHALPHPVDSVGFSFVDRRSEAWLEESVLTDEILSTLLKVFAIYGQAGCTSPKRVVLLNGTEEGAMHLRDRLIELWPSLFKDVPSMHIASANVMARQWAAGLGWNAQLTESSAAVVVCGDQDNPACAAPMLLTVVAATPEQAQASLPENIQTLGYALEDPSAEQWMKILSASRVKRFVPLGNMHHFGPVWDGWDFWRQLFEEVEIQFDSTA